MTKAIEDVISERKRQIENNGYDHTHDDLHVNEQLITAAFAFAYGESELWPWDLESWNKVVAHNHSKREMLVKSAALLIAEIERIDRYLENKELK